MAEHHLRNKLLQMFKGESPAVVEELLPPLARMPAERLLFLTGIAAGLAGLSLRATGEFLRVAPEVGRVLNTFELRTWGEAGKRLAATNIEAAHEFFTASPATLTRLPQAYRLRALTLCTKQASLSTRIAVDCFKLLPDVVTAMGDTHLLQRILAIANEVARHSVKHSHDLLAQAPAVGARLEAIDSPDGALTNRVLELTSAFVHRSGGTAAEFFLALPDALGEAGRANLPRLLDHTALFLDRSGGLALHYFKAATTVLKLAGTDAFEVWTRFSFTISTQGNATSYQFLQLTPNVVAALVARRDAGTAARIVRGVIETVTEIGRYNATSAIECFKASPRALQRASLDQFRAWAARGIELYGKDPRGAQAFYGLQSKTSREALTGGDGGLTLESVSQVLRLYVEGLTGRGLAVGSLSAIPEQARIGDGKTIYLPALVADFPDPETNFRLYKVLAAHAAGQIEYATHAEDTPDLMAIQAELFDEFNHAPRKRTHVGYATVLKHFPQTDLAGGLFTTLENGRIDRRLRRAYRGIRRDLDFVGARLRESRPALASLGQEDVWREILFRIASCGGPGDEALADYGPIVAALEDIVATHLDRPDATVADTLQAVRKVYALVKTEALAEPPPEAQPEHQGTHQNTEGDGASTGEEQTPRPRPSAPSRMPGEVLNFWAADRTEPIPVDDLLSAFPHDRGAIEHQLEAGDKAFFYDEWDRELNDYRLNWCRVIERRNPAGSRTFIELTRSRHGGLLTSIRHQFQMMKPESLRRITGELDGEDFDLEAAIANAIDRRSSGITNERLYIRRLRRQRDVAVSFLLDMSSSTARTISRHPNQPYTRPGQRIIDLEKEGLVLMSEALEAVGDVYSIYGFSSEGRRNVQFYVIKDFDESHSDQVERRIGGVTYHNNTRLGAALRHAATRLGAQPARTKLLILLSDGRPYDHDYGDARYAREDTKVALRQARMAGITSFCITIDREGEKELKDLYGDVGYTIIDDILSLPERLPGIYRRLTT